MSVTRFDAENTLFFRWQGALLFVYQRANDPNTGSPPLSNQNVIPDPMTPTAIYNDPLGYGLRQTGHPPGNPAAVSDSDVAMAVASWDMFLDLSEYRLGTSILASFTDVTESDFGRSASYNQYADRLQKRLDALMKQYASFLSPFRPGASSGVIRNQPATSFPPRWGPGYGGPSGRGFGGYGGYGSGGWGC